MADRTPYLITWYTAADESGAGSLDQVGIKKLTSYNENLFFRILSAHIAQDKDKSTTASNKYIKLCLEKISGNATSSSTTSSTGQRPGQTSSSFAPKTTGTTGAAEAERRRNLLGGFRPKGFGGYPTSASTPYNQTPPNTRTRPPERTEVRTEGVQTGDDDNDVMDIDESGITGNVNMEELPFHNVGPSDAETERWNLALDRALSRVNDRLQDAGTQVDLVERGRTVGNQTDQIRPTTGNSGAQTDLGYRDLGFRREIGTQNPHFDTSTSVEIGHLPNNQATFSVQNSDLARVGELRSQRLDYLPEPGPRTVVIDRDAEGERQTIDLPDVFGEEPAIARVDAPVSYDLEPERLEEIIRTIPEPEQEEDDIRITSSLPEDDEEQEEESVHVDVLPQAGESETEAVERVVRPIFEEYTQTPPVGNVRLNVALQRNRRRLDEWRETHPPRRLAPIDLEPGFEVRRLTFPTSGEVAINLHPPNVGVGTTAEPFIHAASNILRESRSEPLETSHIVLQPNIDLAALPGSHTQPRDVIFHIPGPNGTKLVRPSGGRRLESIVDNLKRKATTQPGLSRKFARPNDRTVRFSDQPPEVRIFRREHLPNNEIELVLDPAPNSDPFTGQTLHSSSNLSERDIRQRQIRARRIRASNNEADALYRILRDNNTPTGRSLVPGVTYTTKKGVFHGPPLPKADVEVVTPVASIVEEPGWGYFEPKHRTALLRAHLRQRKLYSARKLLAAQRRLIELHDLEHTTTPTVPVIPAGASLYDTLTQRPKTHTVGNMMKKLEAQFPGELPPDPLDEETFAATARRLEETFRQRRKEQGKKLGEDHFDRTGKGVAIHHAAKTIFGTLMNPSTSDDRFNLNVRMLNQVVKHWPPQPAHDTITNWFQIFAQNPRGQTLTVDPYERQAKINSLFKLVHGPKNKLYPYVDPEEYRRGAGSKHHAREPHIICPEDGSAKHYRDRRTLGKKRLSRVLPQECFYHPVLSFGGQFLNRVC
jgi:hypothetical protein